MAELYQQPTLFADGSLKAYFRFESGALTTDTTAGAHTLTAISDPAETTGKFGGGVVLDGNDAYSSVDHADFKPTGAFSIGFWVKTSTDTGYRILFQSYSQNTNPAGIFMAADGAGIIRFVSGKNSSVTEGVGWEDTFSTSGIADNAWHFVVGTWDTATLKIYIDGAQNGVGTAWANAPVYAATNYVRIGCGNITGSNYQFVTGSFDDVFLYNGKALTPDEVLTLYRRGVKKINGLNLDNGSEIYTTSLFADANLQGYWRLESDGTDSGPNGYNVAPGNAPEGYVAAKFGNGADFERANSDYLTLADASCPNLEIAGSQTWSCWFKPESLPGYMYLTAKADAAVATFKGLAVQTTTSNCPYFGMAGLTPANVTSTVPLVAGYWYHICGLYNSATQRMKIFVNGVKTEVAATGSGTDTNSAFSIGRGGAYNGHYSDGIIDDVAVWNRALTDTEVLSLFTSQIKKYNGVATLAPTELYANALFADSTLKAYYRFESGALTTDESGEAHTLTAISDPAETTGKFGGGVALDGNDGYSAVDHADFKPTGVFTMGAWFKTTTTGAYQMLFASYSQNTAVAGCRIYVDNTNIFRFSSGKNTGTGLTVDYNQADGLGLVTDGVWHFGVGVWDGATMVAYVDGVRGTAVAWANAPAYAATNYVRIGCQKASASAESLFFTGDLDEVFMLNGTALTAEQVKQLYFNQVRNIRGIY